MRTKEVEKAIKYCNLLLAGDITVHIRNEYGETEYAGDVDKQYNEDLKTVLEYIEELEQLPNKIRYKIKHCENIKDVVDNGTYTFKEVEETIISVLKELLGE